MNKTFIQLATDYTTLSRDDSAANLTLGKSLINTFISKVLVVRDWVFNRSSYAETSVANQQSYPKPYNCWRIRSIKVKVGDLYYFPKEITSREIWTNLNRTVVTSDSASRFFVENDTIELYPVPSTAGNTITIYFQKLIKDLGAADYETGTVSVTTPYTTAVVGSTSPATVWVAAMVGKHLIPTDDGYAYEISAVGSPTSITTVREVRMTLSESAYKIAELIPLPFGFQDIPLWFALSIYFQSKEGSINQSREYERMAREGLAELLRRDAKSTGSILTKTELEEVEGLIDVNKYPLDMS